MSDYSTRNISETLLNEIKKALQSLDYGSVELYVNKHEVVQITQRKIRKTKSSPLTKRKK